MGPNYTDNLEIYKNTNFKKVQNLFDTTQKMVLYKQRDSECEHDCMYISFMVEIFACS